MTTYPPSKATKLRVWQTYPTDIDSLKVLIQQLLEENEQLKAENAEPRRRLGLDSGNSHKPPSGEGYKKAREKGSDTIKVIVSDPFSVPFPPFPDPFSAAPDWSPRDSRCGPSSHSSNEAPASILACEDAHWGSLCLANCCSLFELGLGGSRKSYPVTKRRKAVYQRFGAKGYKLGRVT